MRPVKFNVGLPNGDFANISTFAKRAEELGYYSISIDDHFFMRNMFGTPDLPHLECYTVLAALATATRAIRLAPLVTAMSYRTPQLLAKIIATLDNISGGRLIAGLGAGWFKEEYDAYIYPYPSNAERMEQLADGIKLLKAMWTQEAATYSGRFFKVEKAFCNPKPVQKPYPPIMIGGGGKRILQIAAQEADILNLNPPVTEGVVNLTEAFKFDKPEVKRRIAMVKEFLKAAGRQSDALEISGGGFVIAAKDSATADAMIAATARAVGIADVEAARNSPLVLAGTFEDLKRELAWRVENFGMTYYFLNFQSLDAMETFAKEVMPSFTR
ncbi:MAG TPA: LLM class flavin-dependent oxidoreductase [Candidatus Acidoferrales bacterium]|nr:LLM class flavin-dependent oxidoreductase [Candidatus Acidoferrales bacterium]